MTKLQKVSCIILSVFFFAVLLLVPGPFFLRGNVYRQLPLYCFLEEEARSVPQREDPETYEKLVESNAKYLADMMKAENLQSGSDAMEGRMETADEEEKGKSEADLTENKNQEEKPQESDRHSQEQQTAGERKNSEKEMVPTSTPDVNQEAGPPSGSASDSNVNQEAGSVVTAQPALAQIQPAPVIDLAPEALADYDYLLNNFFIVDEGTSTSAEQLNAAEFFANDLTVKKDPQVPQILIYHSHTQEAFADSREGVVEDSIVGVGNYLAQILTETYGYQVLHVTEEFDLAEGVLDRNKAYDYARPYIERILKENPSIEVVIDLHRDGVAEERHLVTEINGKPTAQIMFFNGLSYTVSGGPVDYLPNPYIQDNLAFSFQMEYQAAQYYPDFYRGIYLSGLRYNLHLCRRAVLLEAGAQTNTVQEVKNAMEPFADILNRVLTGENKNRS
ncbi:stage II sporulation protein P [Blautia sp. XA-2221]|uniref:stage II sporulation protein P n=1 Tax=Blautia sp. XA-2221 TaxID=2903961 RepID=UPI002377DD35|nr:stage II sporulation protein P [Blautia sp. XA-2221]